MKLEEFCPYCDKLVELNVSSDYWEYEEGETFDEKECPECGKIIDISYETRHEFYFNQNLG
jgi:uncharacterized radical SAM superfamily Fe-S cluster-containing enzyme